MAKGTFADESLGTSDGEIIWDDPSGPSIITRVFIRQGERQEGQSERRSCDDWSKGWICFDNEQRTTSQGMQVDCRSSEDQGSRFLSRTSRRNAAMPIFYWHFCPPWVTASQVVLVVKNPPANAGDIRDVVRSWLGELSDDAFVLS